LKHIFLLVSLSFLTLFIGCGSEKSINNSYKQDRQAPTIHLIGESEIILYIGETYEEFGAEAVDNFGGDISENIVISSDLDMTKTGRYTVTYRVSDKDGNYATISRVVKVEDEQGDLNVTMIIDARRTDTFIMLHDNVPAGAYYTYEDDAYVLENEKVLALHSDGIKNSFHILGYETDVKYNWAPLPSHQNRYKLSWDGKFDGDFIIYVVLKFQTSSGEKIQKDLVYTPSLNGYENYTSNHMHIFLGEDADNGVWHHFERNILEDLHIFYPNAVINSANTYAGYLNGIAVRGNGRITNMQLSLQ